MTISPTRINGSGEASGLLKLAERAMPVVSTAQFVVLSKRVRHTVLRYISPRYRCDSAPISAVEKPCSLAGASASGCNSATDIVQAPLSGPGPIIGPVTWGDTCYGLRSFRRGDS